MSRVPGAVAGSGLALLEVVMRVSTCPAWCRLISFSGALSDSVC